jgi:hypothetical protein
MTTHDPIIPASMYGSVPALNFNILGLKAMKEMTPTSTYKQVCFVLFFFLFQFCDLAKVGIDHP